jgi:predicted nucleic-acid-binding protein
MVAVDTNIIVRFLTQDDPDQYQKSVAVFSSQDVFISHTVLLESEWVLRFAYKYTPDQIVVAFRKLCGLPTVRLQSADVVMSALAGREAGLDFADALHLAQAGGCEEMLTFDRRFTNRASRFSDIPVRMP